MPVAAYGGKSDLMRHVSPLGPVYQAGTLSGNPVGMAAGIATLKLCQKPGFYDSLASFAKRLASGLIAAAHNQGIALQAPFMGGMLGLAFSNKLLSNFSDA